MKVGAMLMPIWKAQALFWTQERMKAFADSIRLKIAGDFHEACDELAGKGGTPFFNVGG